ncbi:helix-turn-helix domain-containing protein [Lysinibacillus fusiformis]|uniref:helix-turn-helix domain-containing protein n=1 Tax=Lysinibacillus fusiformis TaxID=28031 RepID=UPI00148E1C29|nr:helix-turn-helix transcriptional regulator [Lysinibacillus fusiformis]NOG26599.1 helix-turn-helix transcriptional regulator [Lysinibacillus fusiformis]
MKYGEILKKLRIERGLSQKELTDRLAINRSTYARYETSSTQPDFDTLKLLAEFFNVTTDYLLGNTNNPAPLSQQEKDEAEFQAFANNPTLQKWYKELPKSKEEDLEKLRKMWEILKDKGEL